MALSTRDMRSEWAEYECNKKGWTEIEFLGRSPVRIIDVLVEAWRAAESELVVNGYPSAQIVSSYVCRDIRDGKGRSLHAFRLALDIDPELNPRQGDGATMDWSKCAITRQQVDAVEAIRTKSGAQVFRNGYVFENPDPMHFQIACSKADIASGIDHDVVAIATGTGEFSAGHPGAASPAAVDADVATDSGSLFCTFGDGKGEAQPSETVMFWQIKLSALGLDTGGADGRYGDMTRAAVRSAVPGSSGDRIGPIEAAHIDISMAGSASRSASAASGEGQAR